MELKWTVEGAYANWRLKIDVEPVGDEPVPEVSESMGQVFQYFYDRVSLVELTQLLDETPKTVRPL